ncbi:MAG: multiprotein bridging factor aMBF1 [archaeon]
MNCEMCGRESELKSAIIEGVTLKVCDNCSRFGKVLETRKEYKEYKEDKSKKSFFNKEPKIFEEVVEDFSLRIKKAREDLNLKQEELALKINEKESIIHHLETGKLRPSLELARKIERFFNIKLIEKREEEKKLSIDFKSGDLTIGDLLKKKDE